MRTARTAQALALAWVALCLSCGGRSALRADGTTQAAGGGHGSGGAVPDGGIPDADAPDAPPPPPPCELELAGDPAAMFTFGGGSADAPDLVVLDGGDPSSSGPAIVAVKARAADANMWHPEIHLARVSVGADWPSQTIVDHPLTLFAFESHEWATLAPSASSSDELALFWHYAGALVDPPSLRFQRFDTSTWTASPPVDVAIGDEYGASQGLAPGAGLGSGGIGYGGEGYAAAFRQHVDGVGTNARVALLSVAGAVTLGPFTVAPPADYPGRGATVEWTGSSYLVATAFLDCPAPSDVFCAPRSTVLLRLRPPQAAGDPGGVEPTLTVETLASGTEPTRPRTAQRNGTTWLAWTERDVDEPQSPRVVRMVRAAADGTMIGSAQTVTTDGQPATGLALAVNQHGVALMWGREGDPSLPPELPGHQQLVIHHLDFDLEPIQSPLVIEVPAIAYYPGLAAVALDHPKSMLLSWSALEPDNPMRNAVYLNRLDCVP